MKTTKDRQEKMNKTRIRHKKSKKSIASIALVIALFVTFTFSGPYGIHADTEDDLNAVEEQAEEARNEMSEMIEVLDARQAELDVINDEIYVLEQDIYEKQLEIDDKLYEISIMQDNIDDQKGGLGNRLRNMYKSGSVGVFDVLLDSANFSEFLSNLSLVQRIYDSDQKTLEELEKQCRELERALAELEDAKAVMNADMATLESRQWDAEIAKAEVEEVVEEIRAKVAEYEAEAERLAAVLEEERAEIQRQLEAAAAAAAAGEESYEDDIVGMLSGASDTGFVWPCYGVLTSYFGYRDDVPAYATSNHGGIDIGVPYYTPIYAARSGIVSSATGWSGGYGYAVYLIHDSGYSTVYGHNSQLLVGPGEYVEQGQLIAYAGSTGNSTGPHLHFEVRVNGVQVDPLYYLP